jgi:hypothetical protein
VRYPPRMGVSRDDPRRGDRRADFSRAELRWLGALVIAAVLVSAAAAMVSDETIAKLLGVGWTQSSRQTNTDGASTTV